MKAMTVDELRALIAHASAPCVSIYMPTHRGGTDDDRAQYAGYLRRARELLSRDYKAREIEPLLRPLEELDTHAFWSEQLEGLAVFASKAWSAYYRLPLRLEELVVVADSFHVRPLLHFLRSNQRYFLLNLSQGRVSFFKGSATGLGAIDLASMPRSLAETVGVVNHERSQHLRSGRRGTSPVYQGSGHDDSVRDEDLQRFLRDIDRALWEVLREETAPLIVASTPRITAAFQAVSRYPHLLHESVHGSFADAKLADLHAKAWPIVQAWFQEHEQEVVRRYGNSISRDRALDEVSAIARFAVQGRVRDLFVESDAHLWGRMDPLIGRLEMHETRQEDAHDDVMDDIAEAVILRGGEVHALPRSKMPTRSPVAAILRW